MPRYFFNLHDGRTVIDHEGMELDGLMDCGREALRRFDQFLATEVTVLSRCEVWHLEAIDGDGNVVLTLNLTVKALADDSVPVVS